MKNHFELEGFLSVKVTPLGENLFLLEDNEEGVLESLILEESEWLGQWFVEVRRWKEDDVNHERVT